MSSFYILDINSLLDIQFTNIFFHSVCCLFILLFLLLCRSFWFYIVPFVEFCFCLCFWCHIQKLIAKINYFLLGVLWYQVLCLSFWNFKFIFVSGVIQGSNFIFLHVFIQFSQHHLRKRLSIPQWVFLVLLSYMSWLYIWGFNSGFSVLFICLCLFLCQHHTVIITIAL